MKILGRPIWAEIDLATIYNNLAEIRKVAKDKKIISVVKDDAYGHSAKKVICKIDGLSDFFGVSSVKEALDLRELTSKPFLVFGGIFDGDMKYVDGQIIPVVYDFDVLNKLKRLKDEVLINIEIETGMVRTGFNVSEADRLIKFLKEAPNIKVQGIMTHFSSADCDENFTIKQVEIFKEAVKKFLNSGIKPEIIHIANSAGIFYNFDEFINAVRPGILLYGGYPDEKFRKMIDVKPAMTFKTKIISLKKVPKDTKISYGGTFKTDRESLIATLAVGYGDGYLRALSNKGIVYIKDKGIAKVCGRVCMDMIMIDVTDIKDVTIGDEVVLWGGVREEVHPDNIAKLAGTISYELFCLVSKKVKRIYKG